MWFYFGGAVRLLISTWVSDSTYTLPLQKPSTTSKKIQFKTNRDEQKPGTAGMVQVLSISWFFSLIFLDGCTYVVLIWMPQLRSIPISSDLLTRWPLHWPLHRTKATRPCNFSGVQKSRTIASPQHDWEGLGLPWHGKILRMTVIGAATKFFFWWVKGILHQSFWRIICSPESQHSPW